MDQKHWANVTSLEKMEKKLSIATKTVLNIKSITAYRLYKISYDTI